MAANPQMPSGGIRLSTLASGTTFTDELPGDVVVYSTGGSNRMLMGCSSNQEAHMVFNSNGVTCTSPLMTPNFMQTTGINISLLTNSSLPPDMTSAMTTSLANAQLVTSNQAFGIGMLTTSNLHGSALSNVVLGLQVPAPATFMSNVGVGISTSQYPLHIGSVTQSNVSIFAAGDILAFSDARFKAEVRPISCALGKVLAVGGYTFERTDGLGGAGTRTAGVLAQEMQRVLPEAVGTSDDGKLSVAYGNLSALLIEAVKELARTRPATLVMSVTVPPGSDTFEVRAPPLPETFSGDVQQQQQQQQQQRWTTVLISASAGAGPARCCASLLYSNDGSALVQGRCELPGDYALLLVA